MAWGILVPPPGIFRSYPDTNLFSRAAYIYLLIVQMKAIIYSRLRYKEVKQDLCHPRACPAVEEKQAIMTRFLGWSDHLYGDTEPWGSLVCQRQKSKWFYIIVHKGVRVRIVLGVTRGHITRSILHLTKEVSFYPVNSSHICRPEGRIWFPC